MCLFCFCDQAMCVLLLSRDSALCFFPGYVRRRIEAKLINWPFSPLRLASLLRTANIGSLTAEPHPNHVVNFNQAKLIMAFARARPTSKGRKGRSPKPCNV